MRRVWVGRGPARGRRAVESRLPPHGTHPAQGSRKTFDELTAKGVEFLQELSERPYGVGAVLRDNSGNWLVLVEPRASSAGDVS